MPLTKEDKKVIDEELNGIDFGEEKELPEAKSSVTYSLVSKTGYPLLFTVREGSEAKLLKRMTQLEGAFLQRGYTPKVDRFAKQLPVPTGEKCPKCQADLVKFAKGVKCSTNKWDKDTKKAVGCDYIKWND